MLHEDPVIQKLIALGEKHESIRAMVLTSSRTNPNAPTDVLSDYDIEIFAEDPTLFVESEEWIGSLGAVMAIWRDEWVAEWGQRWMRMVCYQDGTKMDIQLGYLDDLRKISSADSLPLGYDIGYEVLLDKDNVTTTLKPPTYKAYILSPPTEAQYLARMETFWMESTYVARYLWRDDIVAVKWRLHELADRGLREVLSWSVAMERGWTWKPGCLGRGLSKALDPDTCRELLESYAAGGTEELWESLFRTTALYRKTAIRVAGRLGYTYPHDLDKRVSIYHETIRGLDRQTTDPTVLAELLRARYAEC